MSRLKFNVLLVVFVLSAITLSACGGALNAQDVKPNDGKQSAQINTELPVTKQPETVVTAGNPGMSGTGNANEVFGVVSAVDARSITIKGMSYDFTNSSVTHGTIKVGDTVNLTFGNSNGTLIVREVKVAAVNGGMSGQINNGNSQGSGVHMSGTPIPEVNTFMAGGGRSQTSGGSASGSSNGRGVGSGH